MGRLGCGRSFVLVLRSGGGVSGAGRAYLFKPVRRAGVHRDHCGHLRKLFADHRIVPNRRRRLSRREQIALAHRWRGVWRGVAGRLCADHRLERFEWRGRHLQHVAGTLFALQNQLFGWDGGFSDAAKLARSEGIHCAVGAGVFCIRGHLYFWNHLGADDAFRRFTANHAWRDFRRAGHLH